MKTTEKDAPNALESAQLILTMIFTFWIGWITLIAK
jgi:hypothetical protein